VGDAPRLGSTVGYVERACYPKAHTNYNNLRTKYERQNGRAAVDCPSRASRPGTVQAVHHGARASSASRSHSAPTPRCSSVLGSIVAHARASERRIRRRVSQAALRARAPAWRVLTGGALDDVHLDPVVGQLRVRIDECHGGRRRLHVVVVVALPAAHVRVAVAASIGRGAGTAARARARVPAARHARISAPMPRYSTLRARPSHASSPVSSAASMYDVAPK